MKWEGRGFQLHVRKNGWRKQEKEWEWKEKISKEGVWERCFNHCYRLLPILLAFFSLCFPTCNSLLTPSFSSLTSSSFPRVTYYPLPPSSHRTINEKHPLLISMEDWNVSIISTGHWHSSDAMSRFRRTLQQWNILSPNWITAMLQHIYLTPTAVLYITFFIPIWKQSILLSTCPLAPICPLISLCQ